MLSKNKIKFIKSLHHKKFRDENKLFIVEGEKMILELLSEKSDLIQELFYTSNLEFDCGELGNLTKFEITEAELAQISTLKNPNKCLAILRKMNDSFSEYGNIILALDNIQDPGNLGTLIRIADWFGIKDIICSRNTVEVYNPKVVQATMGSLFRVNIQYQNLVEFLPSLDLPIYGAFLNGENIYESSFESKAVIVLGNEGNGISEEVKSVVTKSITIPSFGSAESLNVSVAGAIFISEFVRKSLLK